MMHFIYLFVEDTSSCEMAASDLDEAFNILYEYKKAQEESKRPQQKKSSSKRMSQSKRKKETRKGYACTKESKSFTKDPTCVRSAGW